MDISEGQLYSAPPSFPSRAVFVGSIAFMVFTDGAQIATSRRTVGLWSLKRGDVKDWFCSSYLAICKMRLRRDFSLASELRGGLFEPKAVWN